MYLKRASVSVTDDAAALCRHTDAVGSYFVSRDASQLALLGCDSTRTKMAFCAQRDGAMF